MFTELVRISCSFPACGGGLTKYQICVIFHRPYLILYPDHDSARDPGNHPVLSINILSQSLPVLFYTGTVSKSLITESVTSQQDKLGAEQDKT